MTEKNDQIICSADLHRQFNEERKRQGLEEIPAGLTSCSCGSSGNLARKDKSWSSVFDFFQKMFKRK